MHNHGSYLDRKHREISLLDSCLSTPLHPARARSIARAIELKFRLAALVRADRLMRSGSITETARPPSLWRRSGPFAFSFGYQRADLDVRGPAIYPKLQPAGNGWREWTVYTGSGMSAIAALLLASLQSSDLIDIRAPIDCYAETRELIRSFGGRIRIREQMSHPGDDRIDDTSARIVWLDSSMRTSFVAFLGSILDGADLAVFDTTCFSRRSSKIVRAVRWAQTMGIPIALVRSHTKLDCLGIEYGRLGSLVVMAPSGIVKMKQSPLTTDLIPRLQDAVRLLGAAPTLGSFPPFESSAGYHACSATRIASIIRNTHRLTQAIKSRLPAMQLTTFQHGLYLTITPGNGVSADEVKLAAGDMAAEIAAQGLPVMHAGSFGFDFVAVEWCPDAIDGANSLRICGADLPLVMADEIGLRIASWCLRHGLVRSRYSEPTRTRRLASVTVPG